MTSKPLSAFQTLPGLLITLSVLFLLTRLMLLAASPDVISHTDELYQGYVAFEILNGLKTWIQHYQPDAYTAGSLVTGLLAAPLFKLFGTSLFVLKLVPVFLNTASLLLLTTAFYRHFGWISALIAGLLLIFPAPGYSALSVMGLGSHPESLFFISLLYFLFLKLIETEKLRLFFWTGLAAGAACWYSQINLLFSFVIFLSLLFFIPRNKKKKFFLIFPLSALAGLSPWFLYNSLHSWEGISFLGHLAPSNPVEFFARIPADIFRLSLFDFSASFFLFSAGGANPVWSKITLLVLIYLSFLTAFKAVFIKESPPFTKLLPLFLFPFVFIFFFACARENLPFHHEMIPYRFRYFVPFYYVLLFAAAALADRQKTLRIFLGILIALQAAGFIFLLQAPSTAKTISLPGYELEAPSRVYTKACAQDSRYFFYCDSFWASHPSPDNLRKQAEVLPAENRFLFWQEAGKREAQKTGALSASTLAIPDFMNKQDVNAYLTGWVLEQNWEEFKTPEEILSFILNQPPDFQLYFFLQIGAEALTWTSFAKAPQNHHPGLIEFFLRQSAPIQTAFIRGIGTDLLWASSSPAHLERVSELLPLGMGQKYRAELLWGIGWELKSRLGSLDQMKVFDQKTFASLREGYQAKAESLSAKV